MSATAVLAPRHRTAQHAAAAPRSTPATLARVSAVTYWRRRLVVLAGAVLLAFLLTVAIGRVGAEAELADRVAGHAVVAPGETLWDVAVSTAPDGVDPRQQLADLEALNGSSGALEPWTTVLLPAR